MLRRTAPHLARLALTLLGLGLVALLPGCGAGPFEPVGSGGVSLRALPHALLIENGRERPIHFFAVERETAALILWGPCVGEGCRSVRPGGSVAVPYDSVYGARPGSEIVVYWWHAVRAPDGGLRHDSIRSLVTRRG